jgi:hypothetical protein
VTRKARDGGMIVHSGHCPRASLVRAVTILKLFEGLRMVREGIELDCHSLRTIVS